MLNTAQRLDKHAAQLLNNAKRIRQIVTRLRNL